MGEGRTEGSATDFVAAGSGRSVEWQLTLVDVALKVWLGVPDLRRSESIVVWQLWGRAELAWGMMVTCLPAAVSSAQSSERAGVGEGTQASHLWLQRGKESSHDRQEG